MSTVIDIIICIITLSHVKEMVVYVTNGEEVEMHSITENVPEVKVAGVQICNNSTSKVCVHVCKMKADFVYWRFWTIAFCTLYLIEYHNHSCIMSVTLLLYLMQQITSVSFTITK